ncbi:hypothetical protein SEA_LOUIE6_60 [Mycobacterium phage Louie6]|uniref:Uncharacterized protein n=3 Tax=Mycobacterium phage Bxz2 TaxID=205870 RepID=A0A0A7RVB4_BPMB2|nr:hypothetical protein PBI_SPIKE509_61 [Mycobacterium phage Spike509]AJA41935.1 hypothetical protein PBI_PHOXY_61 [Mycobacterium phage Phoxy]AOZ64832.1 hypothetical protein SEA_LOUIE6_60 [Mycobacterium phage Louie6]
MNDPEQLALFDVDELGWIEGVHDYVHQEDE